MKEAAKISKHQNASRLVLLASFLVVLFYFTGFIVLSNVYKYAIVGAFFELLSIPMLLLLVAIPIFSFIHLIKGSAKGYNIASILLIAIAIYILLRSSIK